MPVLVTASALLPACVIFLIPVLVLVLLPLLVLAFLPVHQFAHVLAFYVSLWLRLCLCLRLFFHLLPVLGLGLVLVGVGGRWPARRSKYGFVDFGGQF